MNEEVQAFVDKWAEKSAAKADVLVALGAAKLADHKAENALTDEERNRHAAEAETQWAIVEARGFKSGDEGRLYNEALALAEAYVEAHPEQFVSFEPLINPEGKKYLVQLIGLAGKNGRAEDAAKLTMLELASFERDNFSAALEAKVRKSRPGGRKAEA